MKLIRKTQLNLNNCTELKKCLITSTLLEYNDVVNKFISIYWNLTVTDKKVLLLKEWIYKVDSFLSYRLRKHAAKKAIEVIKSVKNKKDKNKSKSEKDLTCEMPKFKQLVMDLDADYLKISPAKTSKTFDLWLHLSSLGQKLILDIPTKRHKHFNNMMKKGYRIKNSGNLRLDKENRLWLDVILEKEVEDKIKTGNNILGIDLGINKLITTSEGMIYGENFKKLQDELHAKKYLSKSWHRKNKEIKHYIRHEIKQIGIENYDAVVLEDLRKISKNTRGRLNKVTRKYLSFWNRQTVYLAVKNICEENRVLEEYVNPAYTSQIHNVCHNKGIRNGENFFCPVCNSHEDADVNGAKNIRDSFTSKYVGNLPFPAPEKT